MAGAWRGKKPIQRNAIALAHFGEETAIPELKEVALNDPRPMIRGTAYWAIGQILAMMQEHLFMSILIMRLKKFKLK